MNIGRVNSHLPRAHAPPVGELDARRRAVGVEQHPRHARAEPELSTYQIVYVCAYACMYACMAACKLPPPRRRRRAAPAPRESGAGALRLRTNVCLHSCMAVCIYVRMYVRTYGTKCSAHARSMISQPAEKTIMYSCMHVCVYVDM